MTERAVVLTGIGGQGVQLAGQVLARAAVVEGRQAKLFANYGGMMRGGNTEANVVLGDGPIVAPPILSRVWAAVAMHHEHWAPVAPKLGTAGVLLVNGDFSDRIGDPERFAGVRLDVPCTELAVGAGGIVASTMVMLGVLGALTSIATADALDSGLEQALPSYRSEALDLNRRALAVGRGWATDHGQVRASADQAAWADTAEVGS